MTKQIATTPLFDSDIDRSEERNQLQAQLAQASVLQSDETNVDRLSTDAADLTARGLFRPPLSVDIADLLATELRELANSAKDTVPLFRQSGGLPEAGWYEIADATIRPAHPNERRVWRYQLSLSRAGTRGDSFRAIRTNPRGVDHPFGSEQSEFLGIPSTARKTLWYDPDTQSTTAASPTATVATIGPDIERYSVVDGRAALGSHRATLLYDIDYPDDVFGVRAYDTQDESERKDLDNVRQWQAIHQTGHDVDDPIVLATGRLRIRVSEPDTSATGTLTAERWDDSTGEWTSVSLPATEWTPLDLDLIDIGQQRLVAQLLFVDSNDNLTALNLVFEVGRDAALIVQPPGASGSVPAGLADHLDPIAAATERDVQARRALVARSEVRR